VALFVAALLAKESAFGALPLLPALLFAAWTVRGDSDARQPAAYVRAVGPFVIAAGLVFVGRYLALGQLGGHREVDLTSLNFEEYRVLVNRYVFFVFWPFRHLYPERTVGWAVLVLACLAGLGVGLRAASSRIRVLVGVGLAWAVGYGAFFILLRHVAGPWYLYFPLLGLGLAVGAALDGLRSRLAAGVAPEGGHDTLAPDAVVDGAGDRPASGAALDGARDRPVPGAALDSVRDQLASARALKGALLDPGRSLLGAAALVYTIGCLLASPLVRPFNQWHAAGEVMRRYRLGIQMCTDGLPSEISVTLWNAPKVFDDGTDESYLLFGSMIEGFTYDAYMRLIRPGEHFRLFIGQPVTYRDLPADLDISCGWGGPDRRRVVATSAELPLPAFPTD
jgi:hypothetical protein